MSGAETFIVEGIFKLMIVIIAAKFGGYVADRLGQPAVLGELVIGAVLGLSLFSFLELPHNELIRFFAELGIILLLFDVGLESSIDELLKAGKNSTLVAIVGVIVPFILGFGYFTLIGKDFIMAFFVGATLTATSVGLTMRVLSEKGLVKSEEGKIILGAAVIDDIIGLIILSILVDLATSGIFDLFNVGKITIIAVAFLTISIAIGIKFATPIYNLVHSMKVKRTFIISAFVFSLAMSFIAMQIGLATIVGAFAAGLVLETTQHKENMRKKVAPLVELFTPIFFVMAGIVFDVNALMNLDILILIMVLTLIALIGKFVAGFAAQGNLNKLAIGIGMAPRGEVGLIFASMGLGMGLVTGDMYSAIVVVIMLTTFVTPPLLLKAFGNKIKTTNNAEIYEEKQAIDK